MKKIVFYNILFIFIFAILLELSACFISFLMNKDEIRDIGAMNLKAFRAMFSFRKFELKEDSFPIEIFKGKSDKSIIVYGGSYAWGCSLERNQTFPYMLSKYTGKTVYNAALPGMGNASMLYRLGLEKRRNPKINADTIIYICINDHLRRNLMFTPNTLFNEFSAKYNLDKDNNLRMTKYSKIKYFLYSLYITRLFTQAYAVKMHSSTYSVKLFKKITEESYKLSKQIFPNSKFIIIFYCDDITEFPDDNKSEEPFMLTVLKDIQKQNPDIILLNSMDFACGQDILDGKYKACDNIHPSKEVWEKFVPEFVNKYLKN